MIIEEKIPARKLHKIIPLRALLPNAVTALALCVGLTGVRFAIAGDWERAVLAIIVAGILDALDGRIARMMKGESRFGAELDSLSDVIAFGVSPAIIIYLWSLQYLPKFGWIFALAHAVCCAIRLARFNAAFDVDDQPHKSAGFFTGVPSPAGAGLMLAPLYLWLATGYEPLRHEGLTAAVAAASGFLMISNLPTYSWKSLRIPGGFRLALLVAAGLLGAALFVAPWATLSVVVTLYVIALPFSFRSYMRVKRQRALAAERAQPAAPPAA